MLHPGIGGGGQINEKPRTNENQHSRNPVPDAAESFFTEEKQAQKTGFEKEGKNPLHGKGLADNAAGGFGKFGPVGAELKFHGDAGDDADGEVDGEDFGPKARGFGVVLVASAESDGFEDDNEQGKAHGQLREQIMESNREGEVQAVYV